VIEVEISKLLGKREKKGFEGEEERKRKVIKCREIRGCDGER